MEFIIQPSENIHSGKLYYRMSEYSVDFELAKPVGYTILVGYLQIAFSLPTHEALHVFGYHPYQKWIKQSLSVPHYITGALYLFDDTLEDFDMVRIEASNTWKTYYDSSTGWLCIGDLKAESTDQSVEFSTNTIATLHMGNLKALWLQPLFIA